MTSDVARPSVTTAKQASATPLLTLLLGLIVVEVLVQFGTLVGLPDAVTSILSVVLALVVLLLHGSQALGWRSLIAYLVITVGISFAAEALGVATGLVFGPYHYTNLFGPKLLGVPPLIQAAYAAMGYSSLIMGRTILGMRGAPTKMSSILAVSLLAAMIMVAWDVGMDPYQSTVGGIWIWHTGGPYFGVGIHNFIGWFVTVFCYLFVYHLYAARQGEQQSEVASTSLTFWTVPVLLYAAFGLGNIIPVWTGISPYASPENYSGTAGQLTSSLALVTTFVMGIPIVSSLLVLWRERSASPSTAPA
jgi:uncharacterized membrane protein